MRLTEWISIITCTTVFCSCGQDSRIRIPTVEGFEAPADDADLIPVYDRSYYQRTLPDDGRCRVRYTVDRDYEVYAGNRPISERTSPTAEYAAQYATRYEAQGLCRKEPEDCRIVPLRQGYTVTINGDRLNPRAEADWEELARQINFLYRHQLCRSM